MMLKKGFISAEQIPPKFRSSYDSEPLKIAADVVDAVKWQDKVNNELNEMKTQDMKNEIPWLDDIIEDFVAFDLAPSHTTEEARTILSSLKEELETMEESGYGPDARNYLLKLKRDLEFIIEKL